MEPADRPFLLAHHLGGFSRRQAGEEAQCDGVSLFVRQRRERGRDFVEFLARDRDLVWACIGAGLVTGRLEVDVVVPRPDVIDDRVPGQPEEPAPERDAPRLVARQGFQGLDEDELRQVLRVRRAVDAAGDIAGDRQVVVIEQESERPGITLSCLLNQPLDRGLVEGHNERPPTALGVVAIGTTTESSPRRKVSRSKPAADATR